MTDPLPYESQVGCPYCGSRNHSNISWTLWGGAIGPKILHHVKCIDCKKNYNGKTGQPNTKGIVIYTVVTGVLCAVLFFVMRAYFWHI